MRSRLSANLDALRAVAVLLVLAQHLLIRFHVGQKFGFAVPPIGAFGVLLFFVHTSLVLMYSMERSHLSGLRLAENFYVRRAFRIYPLSILAVLSAVALRLDSSVPGIQGLARTSVPSIGRILSNLFLVQNLVKPGSIINVLWSLPFELQMYLFLPLLFLWIGRKRPSTWLLCALWGVSVIVAVAWFKGAAWSAPNAFVKKLSLLQYVPNFLPGIIAFTLLPRPKFRGYLWLPFIFVLIAVYSVQPSVYTGWFLCLTLGFAIPLFHEIKSAWLRGISHRIATYSYGIYLSHQFCIWLVADPLSSLSLWIRVSILVAGLVAIPIVLYHAIEKPLTHVGVTLGDKLVRQRELPVTMSEATEVAQ